MTALALLDRTLADTRDHASWQAVHGDTIGSYAAGKFAKASSVETYIRQILAPRSFGGNAATRSGVRWEPMLLAWAGAEPNSLFIHHPDELGFGATVDGSMYLAEGLVIAETKAKHNKVVTGPTPSELRQMAWQLYCIPEAVACHFVWGELVSDRADGWRLRRDPLTLVYPRTHPAIVAATNLIVPIGREVLAGIRAARAISNGVPF